MCVVFFARRVPCSPRPAPRPLSAFTTPTSSPYIPISFLPNQAKTGTHLVITERYSYVLFAPYVADRLQTLPTKPPSSNL